VVSRRFGLEAAAMLECHYSIDIWPQAFGCLSKRCCYSRRRCNIPRSKRARALKQIERLVLEHDDVGVVEFVNSNAEFAKLELV
jgi:hypothetical protein